MATREEVLKQVENINLLIKEKTGFSLTDEGKKHFLKLLKNDSYEDICEAIEISIKNNFVLGDDDTRKDIILNLEGILYTIKAQRDKPELVEINYLLKIAKNRFDLSGLFYRNIKDILLENYNNNDFEYLKEIFSKYSGYTPLKHNLELYYEQK